MDVALDHPELVKILVPVDAWGLFDRLRWHGLTHWFVHSRLNDNLYRWTNSHPSIIRLFLEYNLFGDKSKVDDDLVTEICEAMREPGAGRAFISFQKSETTPMGFTTNLFGRLGEIEAPTLLVRGTLDKAVLVEGALVASERISDCEIRLMEGCRHWPQKERPEEFADALLSFLERRL
ncbi:alpha/beta hydrolase [Slackia exigua]|uniref:alpha/beta fold hydrolase n=1 Tax=Slackia exigua TaxID=84109 RepID=UPI0028F174D2|nr:alpha/beta hydrolase [Slackia exigua]